MAAPTTSSSSSPARAGLLRLRRLSPLRLPVGVYLVPNIPRAAIVEPISLHLGQGRPGVDMLPGACMNSRQPLIIVLLLDAGDRAPSGARGLTDESNRRRRGLYILLLVRRLPHVLVPMPSKSICLSTMGSAALSPGACAVPFWTSTILS